MNLVYILCSFLGTGSIILTKYNNKCYRIDDFDFKQSPSSTFENSKGQTITFLEYYKTQYGIDIKDPKQPMIVNRFVVLRLGKS